MSNNKIYFYIIFISLILSQNIWSGNSVATSDNLDAFSLNPAGFGLDRGTLTGLYLPLNNNNFELVGGHRSANSGYLLRYNDSRPKKLWHQPLEFKIGLGFEPVKNHYLGFLWNQVKEGEGSSMQMNNNFVFGAIIRPWNFLSLGATYSANEDQNISSHRLGFAIRPLSNHRLTFGADYLTKTNHENKEEYSLHPFANLKLVDGVNLSFSTIINPEDGNTEPHEYQINFGFNFDKGGFYTGSNDSEKIIGVGLYSSEQILPSIFSKKKKGTKEYIRMDLSGSFIEEKPQNTSFISQMLFPSSSATQLRSWLEQMEEYTENPDIDGLIIDLGSVQGGLAKKNEMRRALQTFKDSGKEIIVYSEYGITTSGYFLTAMADKIFISGSTGIDLNGINVEISFYRGLLDTLSIVPEVFRVNYDGKSYKTAGDPYLNRSMSDEMQENYTDLFQSIYDIMVSGISEGRGWSIKETKNIMDEGPYMILADAKKSGIIDSVMYSDQFETYIKNLNDGKNTIVKVADLNKASEYANNWAIPKKDKIALIYAVGAIMPGNSKPGPNGSSIMGDKTINKAIESARKDKDIKAIVLRIDSGGGSALASDNMWREIYRTTTEDSLNIKPFIASMSDIAASGGYYIACEADSILADEATITGSIGVIGIRMNFSQLMKRIGVNTDNIMFGKNADFGTGSRLVTDSERIRIQESINESYTEFKNKVEKGRYNINEGDDLNQVAMGRVFTGKTASNLDMFLVDKIGGLQDAIEVAKNTAGIKGEVEIVEYPKKDTNISFDIGIGMTNILKEQFIKSLPEEIGKHYEFIELMEVLSADEKQMILPYQIEVK